jgi:hypothetical protein
MIGGINRPHVAYLTALAVSHCDPFTTLRGDRRSGHRSNDHTPDGWITRHASIVPYQANHPVAARRPCAADHRGPDGKHPPVGPARLWREPLKPKDPIQAIRPVA